ncbi:MAG: putative thermolysin family peptidase, partial [Ilumatobacteraceae bacterium]|nr:putative thermolysin family peptidase [Ilumatobacteraceae bacterium]
MAGLVAGEHSTVAAGPVERSAVSAAVASLEQRSGRRPQMAIRASTGNVTLLGGSRQAPLQPAASGDRGSIARRFVDQYGAAFGIDHPSTELTESRRSAGANGSTTVRYQQTQDGVPVMAAEVAVEVAGDGSVLSTSGEASTPTGIDVQPTFSEQDASAVALGVTARNDHVDVATLQADSLGLWIYDPSLIGADGPPGNTLVWRFDVRTAIGDIDRMVLIDANTGAVALNFSQREDALNRQVCNNNNVAGAPEACTSVVRAEGAGPNGSASAADINGAYDLTGMTYTFYSTSFGRDGVDGSGMTLKSTVRYCPQASQGTCPYNNAYWNGVQMVFGQGYAAADDVVAHELTHGVTQYTSQLLYYAESGAINESMSDVMGELADLQSTTSGADPAGVKWQIGEQLPGGAIRSMSNPTAAPYNDPDRMTSSLFIGSATDNHGVHTNSGVNNKAAFLMSDGGTFNGQTITGLGTAKTAQIYYEAETALLGPGSDYLDLYNALQQACANLIGVQTISAADCAQVLKVVTATEMNKAPTTPGAHLTAAVCDNGAAVTSTLFSDDMEANNGAWAPAASTGSAAWFYLHGSSQSGTTSLFGPDIAQASTSSVTMTAEVAIPAGSTYLRFDHSFDMDSVYNAPPGTPSVYYDGGVVEYSVSGGPWTDAGSLSGTVNGYNVTLASGFGNALQGRAAFSGPSPGYQTTRISLGTLAGSNIKVRFKIGTDSSIGSDGWFIDDVSVYTCGPPVAPGVPSQAVAAAGVRSATVSWTAPAANGSGLSQYVITPFANGVAQT